MSEVRIVITGGAGFVGSSLARGLTERLDRVEITALDNLKRHGSELALPRLAACGADFVHGDVRNCEDFERLGPFDLLIDCSAEPSVKAGYDGGARELVNTNLMGTINCLEAARKNGAGFLFLSTSRVYPIDELRALPLEPTATRLTIPTDHAGVGWSQNGITTDFPLDGARSLYGATKLASELLAREYQQLYNMKLLINRCGVIAGPWQMGKVDQGFMVLWMARHLFGGALSYMGFGGQGLQVRDVLNVADLVDLITLQVAGMNDWDGSVFNVGGGTFATSLLELSKLCAERAGAPRQIDRFPETHMADVPWFVVDNRRVEETFSWRPRRDVATTVHEIADWLVENQTQLKAILG